MMKRFAKTGLPGRAVSVHDPSREPDGRGAHEGTSSELQVSEKPDRLDITSPMSWGARPVFVLFALFPFLALYELILRVRWTDYRHPFFVLAAAISAGAVALSLFLMFAAVAGLSSRVTLDAARSTFRYSEVAVAGRGHGQVFPLSSLQCVRVQMQEWSDGAPSYSLVFTMADGAAFTSGSSRSREAIERAKSRVEAFLDRHARSTATVPRASASAAPAQL